MSDEFAWIREEISGLKGVQYSFKEEWGRSAIMSWIS